MVQVDTIERVVMLKAPRARVWKALTDPEQIVKWFGNRVEFDTLEVGADIYFGWEEEKVPTRGIIEVVEPPQRFVYRWRPYKSDPEVPIHEAPSTLVTFTLEEAPEGTRLVVVESGFASLPKELIKTAHQENVSGWDAEIKDLVEYIEQG